MRTRYPYIHVLLATLLSIGLLILTFGTVSAHAKVLNAIPTIGSTVTQVPTKVTVFTAENINPDPKKSNLFVYGPNGDLISQGNATVSLTNPKEMSVAIKTTPDNSKGVFVVQWITVSAEDGDPDQGAFVFTVNPSGAATPTPVTGGATPPTTTTTSSPGTGSTPIWVPIVVGIVALLVGLGGGLGIGRGTARPSVGAMRRSVGQQQDEETPVKRP
jgi:copper resistance protein C